MSGKVYLVGAGPGAPDLLTVRAARLLAQAEIVFYDALVHPETLALAVTAEKIAVGKRCGRHSTAQRFINKRLIDAAHRYRFVVRLKGGDPMMFGRAQEEIDALQAAGISVEVVPGVTAALAASAELRIALTRRGVGRSVLFATPRAGAGERPNEWARAVCAADSAVLYMAAGECEAIAATLLAQGKPADTPVLIVENVAHGNSRIEALKLRELQKLTRQERGAPALLMIGEIFRDVSTSNRELVDAVVAATASLSA
jgi:uroporphyrin-III C-methyltransferase